jgi:hypothetical protein
MAQLSVNKYQRRLSCMHIIFSDSAALRRYFIAKAQLSENNFYGRLSSRQIIFADSSVIGKKTYDEYQPKNFQKSILRFFSSVPKSPYPDWIAQCK